MTFRSRKVAAAIQVRAAAALGATAAAISTFDFALALRILGS